MVGVLFAELMVGVLIATFGIVSQLDACVIGQVLHEFSKEFEVLSHKEQIVFVKGLGIPAQFCLDTADQTRDSGDAVPAHTHAVDHPVLEMQEMGLSENSENPGSTKEELKQIFGTYEDKVNESENLDTGHQTLNTRHVNESGNFIELEQSKGSITSRKRGLKEQV